MLVARSPEGLGAAAAEVRETGGEALTLELDLLAGDAPARLEDFLSSHGLICDVLVNSAGLGQRGAATALPIDEQLRIIDLNIRSLSELTLHFLPGMVARKRGGVLNLSSVAGFVSGPYMAVYFASKGFVRFFSEALHQELRRTGVTVTCVAPGPVSTEFLERSGAYQTPLFSILPKLNAQAVAERAWRAFKSGRRLVVPGISAKLAALAVSLLPSRSNAAPDRLAATERQRSMSLRVRQEVQELLRYPPGPATSQRWANHSLTGPDPIISYLSGFELVTGSEAARS